MPVPISGPTPAPFGEIERRIAELPPVTDFGRLSLPFLFDRCGPPSDATLLSFDELPFYSEVTDDYADQGVTFSGGGQLVTQPTDDDVGTDTPPAALSNVAGGGFRLPDRFSGLFGDTPLAWGPIDGDIAVRFTEPVTEVGVFVGLPTAAAELLAVAPRESRRDDAPQVTATLTLYDGSGAVIATDSATLGPDAQAIRTCLYVHQPGMTTADGYAARISYDPPVNETIDSFWFRSSLPVPEVPPRGSIRITAPREGALVADTDVAITGEILSSVVPTDVYVRWHCPLDPRPTSGTISYVDGVPSATGRTSPPELFSDPGDPLRTIFVARAAYLGSDRCGLRHPLTLHAAAILSGTTEPRVEAEIDIEVFHERAISEAPEVRVGAVEITQGIRNGLVTDPATTTDPMIHVAGRPTVVRVYPEWDGALTDRTQLYAELRAYRDTSWALIGSPVLPETAVRAGGTTPGVEDQRSDAAATFNFRVPQSWTTAGTIRLEIRVLPAGVSPSAFHACTGCARPVYRRMNATFAQGGHIDLYFHRVTLVQDAAGNGVDQRAPTFAEFGRVIGQLYQYLPLGVDAVNIRDVRNVTWAGPIEADTDGDGNNEDLLYQAMRRLYLIPAGITGPDPANRGTLYGFYFGDVPGVSCGGAGWLDESYLQSGACTWASTPTHESLHTLGLAHASNQHDEASGGGFDAAYPGTCGQMSYDAAGALANRTWGTDVYAVPIRVIPPDVNPITHPLEEDGDCSPVHVHDLLSYGWGTDWISPYTWNNVLERTGASLPVPVPGLASSPAADPRAIPVLIAALPGTVVRDASTAPSSPRHPAGGEAPVPGQVAPLAPQLGITVDLAGGVRAGGAVLVALPPAGVGEGEVEVEALDASGKTVALRHARISMTEFGASETVVVLLPPDGWTQLVVRRDGQEVGRQSRSASDPQVRLTSPPAGSRWEGDLELQIEASDPDGDGLLATVEVSADGGASWQPVHSAAVASPDTTVVVPREATTAQAGELLLRVQVTDGLRVGLSESVPLTVGAAPPVPVIVAPAAEDLVAVGTVIDLLGEGWATDGVPLADAQLEWVLDGEVIGHGRRWVAGPLEEGIHTLELRATLDGAAATSTLELTVAADADRDGVVDEWEAANGLDPADASDGTSDLDSDGLSARDEYRWRTDPQDADTDGDAFTDGVEVMAGGDPLDPAVGPVGAHGLEGLPLERPMDPLPWVLVAGVAATALAGTGTWWLRRRSAAGHEQARGNPS